MSHNSSFYCKISLLFLMALAGCQLANSASSSIADQFSASGHRGVDLASAVPGNWDRVCILEPYSNNAAAAQALGFKWSAETLTSIEDNENISLLIFVRDNSVIDYVEHPRNSDDFTNLAGQCFQHTKAKFVQIAHPVKGSPRLFPADEASN